MWSALGVAEPAALRDLDDADFVAIARRHGETSHDAR